MNKKLYVESGGFDIVVGTTVYTFSGKYSINPCDEPPKTAFSQFNVLLSIDADNYLVHPSDVERITNIFRQILPVKSQINTQIISGSGDVYTVEAEGSFGRAQARVEQIPADQNRYQALINSMDDGFCIVEVVFDNDNKAQDYFFVEVNPAFEKLTGLHDPVGKSMRMLRPSHEQSWF
ncbi:MAG TPA: PAS domain-containing protein, partial [Cyclobacteriaceae bacterium]|nr:PAS domain-containing protein [Cyclobacteriaceae bacterium]